MKRAPPNHVALSEPPRSKKIKIGESLDTDAADNVEDDPADKKTSSPYKNAAQGSKGVGGSGQDEQWTRVERRKQKKAKKLGHKADVCVFLLDFLYFRGLDKAQSGSLERRVPCTAPRRDLIQV